MNTFKPILAIAAIVVSTMNVPAAFAISSGNTYLADISVGGPIDTAEGSGEGGGPGFPSNPGVPELPAPTPSVPDECKFDLNGDGQVCHRDLKSSINMFTGLEACDAPDGYVCNVMLIAGVLDHMGFKTCPVLNPPAATGCAGDHNNDGHICDDDVAYAVNMFQTGQTYPGTTRLWNFSDIQRAVLHRDQECVAIEDPGMGDDGEEGDDEQEPQEPTFPDFENPRVLELEEALAEAANDLSEAYAETDAAKSALKEANARAAAKEAAFAKKKKSDEITINNLKRKIKKIRKAANGEK